MTRAACQSPPFDRRREVYVVDDSRDVRRSLHELFRSIGITASAFPSADDFLEGLGDLKPAPILLDIRMPGIDGLQMMAELRQRERLWPVIIMTGHGDIPLAVRAMRLGALDFLLKPFEIEPLERALVLAYDMLAQTAAREEQRASARRKLADLTDRERQIARTLATGMTNKEIARALDLSVRTVEMHRANAMRKLAVDHVVELAALIGAAESDSAGGPHSEYSI